MNSFGDGATRAASDDDDEYAFTVDVEMHVG